MTGNIRQLQKGHTSHVSMTGNKRSKEKLTSDCNCYSTNWHTKKGTLKGRPNMYHWLEILDQRRDILTLIARPTKWHTIWHTNHLKSVKEIFLYKFLKYTPSDLEEPPVLLFPLKTCQGCNDTFAGWGMIEAFDGWERKSFEESIWENVSWMADDLGLMSVAAADVPLTLLRPLDTELRPMTDSLKSQAAWL